MAKSKQIIGRTEIIDLPQLDLSNVRAKVDTGAYSSAIHCSRIKHVSNGEEEYLQFKIPGSLNKKYFRVHEFKRKNIKSSSGHIENRFVIKTKVKIFNRLITTEFSLADRSSMKFPILLGRKLLRKGFVVDVSLADVSKNSN